MGKKRKKEKMSHAHVVQVGESLQFYFKHLKLSEHLAGLKFMSVTSKSKKSKDMELHYFVLHEYIHVS